MAGAIIAGGQGRRMGTPHKAALVLRDGGTPVQRLVVALSTVGCDPLVVVANDMGPYANTGLRVIGDCRSNLGPLAGIEAALLALAPDPVCIVAGDMPFLGSTELRCLIDSWDGRLAVAWTDRMQPLCAVVASTLVSEVSTALDDGEQRVYHLWERLGAIPVYFKESKPFTDLDTPEDLVLCQ